MNVKIILGSYSDLEVGKKATNVLDDLDKRLKDNRENRKEKVYKDAEEVEHEFTRGD